jgi:hypothetical protein
MTPVEVFNDRPAGNEPAVTAHVIGVAPVAANVCVNADPVVIPVSAVVVIVGGTTPAVMLPEYAWVSDPAAFVADTVKLYAPETAGLPVSAPVEEFNVRPGTIVPNVTAQVIGVSPVAANVCEKATPWVMADNVVVVMSGGVSAAPTVPVYACTSVPTEFDAVTVKL